MLVMQAGDLALEFTYRPVATHGLNFVEGALEWVVDGNQLSRMAEGKPFQKFLPPLG